MPDLVSTAFTINFIVSFIGAFTIARAVYRSIKKEGKIAEWAREIAAIIAFAISGLTLWVIITIIILFTVPGVEFGR